MSAQDPDKLYSTAKAADYLEMSTRAVKHHYYESKKLKGELIGNSLVFREADLDAFKVSEHRRGFATHVDKDER